jgi:hypothetical protein
MPHSRIIITGVFEEIIGDTEEGSLAELRTAFIATDDKYVANLIPPLQRPAYHDLAHSLQDWLTEGTTQEEGVADKATSFKDQFNAYL